MMLNAARVTNDPDFWFMMPVCVLALTSATGWTNIVILAIAMFVRHHVSGIILLSSTIIYGMTMFVALIVIYNSDSRTISGLTYLLLLITVSVYVLLPLWILTIGLETYCRYRLTGPASAHSSTNEPQEGSTEP